jgi:hypothetical protein
VIGPLISGRWGIGLAGKGEAGTPTNPKGEEKSKQQGEANPEEPTAEHPKRRATMAWASKPPKVARSGWGEKFTHLRQV